LITIIATVLLPCLTIYAFGTQNIYYNHFVLYIHSFWNLTNYNVNCICSSCYYSNWSWILTL